MGKIDKFMREKIFLASQDQRNGSKSAIYKRVKLYGTPFKTFDKRQKYSNVSLADNKLGLSRQVVHNRIKAGWTLEEAMSVPKGVRIGRRKKA